MTEFSKKVYDITKQIPKGYVTTYKNIAIKLGDKNYSRAVGNALHNNPTPIVVPCHRVVNSQGFLAKNFGAGGLDGHKKLLQSEGVVVENYKVSKSIIYSFK